MAKTTRRTSITLTWVLKTGSSSPLPSFGSDEHSGLSTHGRDVTQQYGNLRDQGKSRTQ